MVNTINQKMMLMKFVILIKEVSRRIRIKVLDE